MYKLFTNCLIFFISFFELGPTILLAYILDKRIGKALIFKPLPNFFVKPNLFNPSLFNPFILNPSELNPPELNPTLLNPYML